MWVPQADGCLLCKCCYETLRHYDPFTYAPPPHSLDRRGWHVSQDLPAYLKQKEHVFWRMYRCVPSRINAHMYRMCAHVCAWGLRMRASEGWFWWLAWAMSESSTSHVLDPCSCIDGSLVLMQPSGLSDTEWHRVLFPDLCVKSKMESWVERKRYTLRESRGWGREQKQDHR